MAQPTVRYIVLPEKVKGGQQYTLTPFEELDAATREAARLTACSGDQHIVYTSTHYTDSYAEWLQATINEVVLPYQEVEDP